MVDAIARDFQQTYSGRWMTFSEAGSRRGKSPDLPFCQSWTHVLHVIQAEAAFSRAFDARHGFAQLKKYKGNYNWLALPRQEWERDIDYEVDDECKQIRVSLILVSDTVRFRVVEEIQPIHVRGDFLSRYLDA